MCKPWHTKKIQTKLKATIGFFNHTILLQSIEVPNCLTQPSLLPPRLSKFQLFEAAIAANHQSSCGRLWYWSTLAQRVISAHVDWKPGRTYDWRKPKKNWFSLSDIPFYILLDSGTPWDTTSTWAKKGQVVLIVSGIFWMQTFCKKHWPGHWDRDYRCAFWELSIGTIPLKPAFSNPTRVQTSSSVDSSWFHHSTSTKKRSKTAPKTSPYPGLLQNCGHVVPFRPHQFGHHQSQQNVGGRCGLGSNTSRSIHWVPQTMVVWGAKRLNGSRSKWSFLNNSVCSIIKLIYICII